MVFVGRLAAVERPITEGEAIVAAIAAQGWRDGGTTLYRHSQRFGVFPTTVLAVTIVVMTIAAFFAPLVLVGLIPLIWVGWVFSEFTVEVRSDHLVWFFRSGVWQKRLALADIKQAKPVKNRWWYGWGIHLTPKGLLYNVAGFCAVEIVTKAGHRYRLGTDAAEELAMEITRRLPGSRNRR